MSPGEFLVTFMLAGFSIHFLVSIIGGWIGVVRYSVQLGSCDPHND